MADIRKTVDAVEQAVNSQDKDFSGVYEQIVQLQQSSGDMQEFGRAMRQTNLEMWKKGVADLDNNGTQDFVLISAMDGMIITADPRRGFLQARDKNFNVMFEKQVSQPVPEHLLPKAESTKSRAAGQQQAHGDGQEHHHDHGHEHGGGEPEGDAPPATETRPQPESKQEQWGGRIFDAKGDGSAEYTVERGDTVWGVSTDVLRKRLGREPGAGEIKSEVDRIAAASGLQNANLIHPGEKLVVPAPGQEVAPARPAQPAPPVAPPGQGRPPRTGERTPLQTVRRDTGDAPAPVGGVKEVDGYAFPVVGYRGANVPLHHGSHAGGSDLFAERGTPVVAFRGGTVTDASYNQIGGWSVSIQQDDGNVAYYAHLDQQPIVTRGQQVRTGQQLGVVGDTGNAKGTGTHLHFGVGKSIITGVGPTGGSGAGYNAVAQLQHVLNGTRMA